jgi:hypothetical protein
MTINGDMYEQPVQTGPVQMRQADAPAEEHRLLGFANFATRYNSISGPVEEVVLQVRNREKAVAEINKIITDLGGTMEADATQALHALGGSGGRKGDFLVVKLKPETYRSFCEKFKLIPPATEKARRARGQLQSTQAVRSEDTSQKEEAITLFIRLIEAGQEKAPQEEALPQ